MDNKTVIIIGIRGFVGRHLAAMLRDTSPSVKIVGCDRAVETDAPDCRLLDLFDAEAVCRMVDTVRPDYIFHLAGVVYSRDWLELYRGNVETTVNVLEAVKKTRVPARVIFAGSAAEYGMVSLQALPLLEEERPNPVSPYGVAKVWQTTVARYYAAAGADVVAGRIFNVIGHGVPQGLSIGAFAEQIKRIKRGEAPPEMSVGNLSSRRDFIDVVDVCKALVSLAEAGRSGEIYNICSGVSVSMRELLDMMIRSAGVDVKVQTDPARFKAADIYDSFGSNEKIRKQTGWSPSVSLRESVDKLMAGA